MTAARPRPRKLALVLGGGGALGAFEAGLYEALAEAGLQPDWLAGSSIGAFNAVLIAGNPPERRIERLREFWSLLAQPAVEGPEWGGDARRVRKAASALRARLFGRPGMYAPALPQLFLAAPQLGQPSLYDTTPALDTLRRLVDFTRIEGGEPRITINLTDLISGDSVLIDSASARLRPEHLLASMGLLPEFPPIEIDERWFCDGGFSANVPLHAVLDPPPAEDLLCVAVDLLGEPGPPVFSVDGMLERSDDLLFVNQTRAAVALLEARYAQSAPGGAAVLLLVNLDGRSERIAQKVWDYGKPSILERWRAGRQAGAEVAERIDRLDTPPRGRLSVQRIAAGPTGPG
ncbi:MAG TPA: patatin-like phospholipase family protein [Kofleriaceae bacterium]|nr:patatin-like phospholipase family protein [Kofleriaceae bacterium]